MKDSDLLRLRHITKYCDDIAKSISRYGASFEIFSEDTDYLNSVSMSIMQIGELSIGLSEEFRSLTREQMAWGFIRGMRNMFAHGYYKMDKSIIWEVATKDIPILLEFCNKKASEYVQC